jgi:hypothetical protein
MLNISFKIPTYLLFMVIFTYITLCVFQNTKESLNISDYYKVAEWDLD